MTREEWLRLGVESGFCTQVFCSNHDGWPPEDNDLMEKLWNDYEGDHCLSVVRIKA